MEAEILQYEQQLIQIQHEIATCEDVTKREALLELENEMKQLITLTKEAICPPPTNTDPLDAEYDLFRAELALEENTADNPEEAARALVDLEDDLRDLPGMKCQAPFKYAWAEDPTFHNALVYKVETNSVTSSDDIKVRVMFTNPTHTAMKPCSYYLEGECKFSVDKCRFSHGELVALGDLKDFREPDFTNLDAGSRVLVKQSDDLWHRARLLNIQQDFCNFKLESSSKEDQTHLQNILPLASTEEKEDDSSSSSSDDNLEDSEITQEVVTRILNSSSTAALGEWERYTKGVGSRLMAKMGYVFGAGLGVNLEGRVDPVPAVIYPVGKSLDHCMMLKENAGGDQDLFKADRKMKRLQRKHEEALGRAYEREKQKTDVFTFLNEKLQDKQATTRGKNKELRKETQKGLNVTSLQLSEDVRKTEKQIRELQLSLARHGASSPTHTSLQEKIKDWQSKLNSLQASERQVSTELQQRKDRKKLAVF